MAGGSFIFGVLASSAIVLLLIISSTTTAVDAGGFSVQLIHRDSPKSPFHNPLDTQSQRLANAFQRSISRVLEMMSNQGTTSTSNTLAAEPEPEPQSSLYTNRGEYLMELSIGTPPFPILAIADTGSDLIWTQCLPCNDCYDQTAPLFDPSKSTTYKNAPCGSSICTSLDGTCDDDSICEYSVSYGDRSHTSGYIATDTLTLKAAAGFSSSKTIGRPISLPKTIIGCGHDNGGTFSEKGSGIVGLGGSKESLISQLDSFIDGKFSYCLVPISSNHNSSILNFGSNAFVSGSGAVSTPLLSKQESPSFYYLALQAISVGDTRLSFSTINSSTSDNSGNIIIDSGTTLTLLPQDFYSRLEKSMSDQVKSERVDDPTQSLNLCYKSQGFEAPDVTVHFNGADVKLKTLNTFVEVADGVLCFAFAASPSLSIYGNLSQMDFLVGYDRHNNTVTFKPTDCTMATTYL